VFVLGRVGRSGHTDGMRPAKNDPIVEFWPTKMQSYDGSYVQVIIPGIPPIQLGGFKTEDEAKRWVGRYFQS
jgi:hypothetical protein